MEVSDSGSNPEPRLTPSVEAWSTDISLTQGTSSRAPSALSIRAKTSKDFRADASGPSTPNQARGKH